MADAAGDLKRTPLFEAHRAAGARLIPFGGWEMPVQYSGIIDEHRSVRSAAGLFDVSHMGRFLAEGAGAFEALQGVLSADLSRLVPGQARYSLLLNESGGILDDLFVYRTGDWAYLLVVNASNTARDWDWIQDRAAGQAPWHFHDVTVERAMIAVQGPAAIGILDALSGGAAGALPRHGSANLTVAGVSVLACRTGYTGEDGVELILPADRALEVWDALIAAGVKPCGLGARDTLRLEAAYPLHGQDIDATTNPIEAGLGWAVALDKGDFVGCEAVAAVKDRGPDRRLACFVMTGRGIARAHYPIWIEGRPVGEVTSGSYAPTLDRNIGLGYLPADRVRPGTPIEVLIRDKPVAAEVVRRPFYKNV